MDSGIYGKKSGHLLAVIALLGGTLTCILGRHIPSFAGNYYATVRRMNNETTEYNSTGKLWVRVYNTAPKPRQLQYFWGKIYSVIEVTDDMKMEIRVSQWSNNEWKRNAFVFKFDRACSSLLFHGGFMARFAYGNNAKCPLPKTNLRLIENQTMDIKFPHFPIMPYGRYLFTLAYIKHNEIVGVIVVDGNLNPQF